MSNHQPRRCCTGSKSPTAEFVAAGVAAAVELTAMQPLDVIKTRLHLQGSGLSTCDRFTGTGDALRAIHRVEGLRGLWRGFGTGLVIVVPRRGLKFAANSTFTSSSLLAGLTPRQRGMLAGGLAGACEAMLITPLETCKIALQSERTPRGAVTSSTAQILRAVARRSGFLGLYSGLQATMFKHSLHSCVFFATFAELRAACGPPSGTDSGRRVLITALSGFGAGVAAGAVNNPFDVIKSQIQVAAAAELGGHSLAKEYAASSQGQGLLSTAVRQVPLDPSHLGPLRRSHGATATIPLIPPCLE